LEPDQKGGGRKRRKIIIEARTFPGGASHRLYPGKKEKEEEKGMRWFISINEERGGRGETNEARFYQGEKERKHRGFLYWLHGKKKGKGKKNVYYIRGGKE